MKLFARGAAGVFCDDAFVAFIGRVPRRSFNAGIRGNTRKDEVFYPAGPKYGVDGGGIEGAHRCFIQNRFSSHGFELFKDFVVGTAYLIFNGLCQRLEGSWEIAVIRHLGPDGDINDFETVFSEKIKKQ